MSKFVMQRDRTVATLSGHVIAFKKGEETYVPPAAWSDVMAAGAVPVEEIEMPDDPTNTLTNTGEELNPEERKRKIHEAFDFLKKRNARGDFAADGKPHPKAVSQVVGFTVESRERNKLWDEYINQDE